MKTGKIDWCAPIRLRGWALRYSKFVPRSVSTVSTVKATNTVRYFKNLLTNILVTGLSVGMNVSTESKRLQTMIFLGWPVQML